MQKPSEFKWKKGDAVAIASGLCTGAVASFTLSALSKTKEFRRYK